MNRLHHKVCRVTEANAVSSTAAEHTSSRMKMVHWLAHDMRCKDEEAADAIVELLDNQRFSIVMAGYRSNCLW